MGRAIRAMHGLVLPDSRRKDPFDDQIDPIDERIDPIDERKDPIDERIDPIDERKDPIDERIDPIDERKDPIDERIDPIDERIDLIDERIHSSFPASRALRRPVWNRTHPFHAPSTDVQLLRDTPDGAGAALKTWLRHPSGT